MNTLLGSKLDIYDSLVVQAIPRLELSRHRMQQFANYYAKSKAYKSDKSFKEVLEELRISNKEKPSYF